MARKTAERGLTSLVKVMGPVYELECGDRARLRVGRVWWKPGAATNHFFREPGEYGISFTEAGEPEEWRKIEDLPVFVYSDAASWSVDDVDWMVGCANTREAQISFLQNEAWAGFDPYGDDSDYEALHDSYQDSLTSLIRQLIGNCVERNFVASDLTSFMKNEESRIELVRYLYQSDESSYPRAIEVTNAAGEQIELLLM